MVSLNLLLVFSGVFQSAFLLLILAQAPFGLSFWLIGLGVFIHALVLFRLLLARFSSRELPLSKIIVAYGSLTLISLAATLCLPYGVDLILVLIFVPPPLAQGLIVYQSSKLPDPGEPASELSES